MKQAVWIAAEICFCLMFVCSALIMLGSRTSSTFVTLEQAIAPYVNAIGQNPDDVYPGSQETVLSWGRCDPIVLVVRRFEKTGWEVVAFYQRSDSVPSEWALMVAMAMKKWRGREIPRDPWGRPITDMNVLHPEERW
jgi:hypothetical protein